MKKMLINKYGKIYRYCYEKEIKVCSGDSADNEKYIYNWEEESCSDIRHIQRVYETVLAKKNATEFPHINISDKYSNRILPFDDTL